MRVNIKATRKGGLIILITIVVLLLIASINWQASIAKQRHKGANANLADLTETADIEDDVNSRSLINKNMLPSNLDTLPQITDLSIDDFVQAFDEAKGGELRRLLDRFWGTCDKPLGCDALLKLLIELLDKQSYWILVNYQQLQSQRNTLMGLELVSQNIGLSEKVAQVKYIDQQVWGDTAERLFADQYAIYQYRLASQELDFLSDAQDYLDQYQALRQSHGKTDGVEAYEQAIAWLPQGMSKFEQARAQALLAEQYLSKVERKEIIVRNAEVAEQTSQVRDYHSELGKLQQSLDTQRATSHRNLSESEWTKYQQSQIYRFRMNFFNA